MDGRIVRCDIISSCQSAATSEVVYEVQYLYLVQKFLTGIITFEVLT